MRQLFRAFYPLSEGDREKAWSEGLIIFDTSALLNLYRYPLAARDRLLTVLSHLKERLWLPHQAVLEYHRNQPAVRLEQTTRIQKVREEVGALKIDFKNRIDKLQIKKRHALIDAEQFTSKVMDVIDDFQRELNQIEREQDDRYQEGILQLKIEELFEGRVGQAPTQDFLDTLYKEGAKRYEHKIPPGYQDSSKGDAPKDATGFMFGGLLFQRRFGDLILWKEILQKTLADSVQWFIFVTDDAKEDWWQVLAGRRIGPRPELLDEAIREGGVEGFIVETSERFTEHAARLLDLEVSDEVIQQISTTRRPDGSLESIPEEAGFLEKIADAEEGLEELTQISEGLTLELQRISGVMEDSTKKLKASKDARMRTRITNETASKITEVALGFEEKVEAFETSLRKIEPGIDFIVDRIDQIEAEGGEAPAIRETLKSLFVTIIGTIQVAQGYDTTLAGIPEATASLRNSIRRLREGVQHYIRVARLVQRWLDHWE